MSNGNQIEKKLPEVKSPLRVIAMNFNIQLGALNIGYVLTYLSLTIDTLFATLEITDPEDRIAKLSIINGILPLGCFVGVLFGYFLKQYLSLKQCLFLADAIGILSIMTLVADTTIIIVFRLFLGIANGISSLIMPQYVKSICPEKYYVQLSLILGYGVNTGLTIGQLMGIGYISFNGADSNWWRIVFIFPPLICIIRSSLIYFVFNYDCPEQLIAVGKEDQAKEIIREIYLPEYEEVVLEKYRKMSLKVQQNTPFSHAFHKINRPTLSIGLISMIVQIWCGSFAVFYYSAQIFQQLADGDLVMVTVYSICIGIFSFFAQFSTVFLIRVFGGKYMLVFGAILMGMINIAIGIMSSFSDGTVLFMIFILLVLLIVVFAVTLGPVGWAIVPQLNDSDGTFVSMEARWGFQAILVFVFPFIVRDIQILGAFLIFGVLDLSYALYCQFFIRDPRGMTQDELIKSYRQKYTAVGTDGNIGQ